MTAADSLDRGRASFARQAWGDAYAQLTAADREAALDPDHTVRRHLQNIFNKIGVSSRAGATAFAFQRDLV